MTSTFRIDLKQFDETYSRAGRDEARATPQPVVSAFQLPDGQYRVKVERVELTTAKSSGNPMLKWRLRIALGQFENRLIFKNRAITDSTIEWVKKEMQTCGLDLTPFSSLPSRLEELTGIDLAVSKVTKNGNENVYIRQRLSPLPDHELAALADELPF